MRRTHGVRIVVQLHIDPDPACMKIREICGICATKKPPRCIAAGGGSVLIAQGVYARVSILRNL